MSYIQTSALKNSTIMWLFSEKDKINLEPEYQRFGGIWTTKKKQLLIDSILNDYDIPKIYFHVLNAPGLPVQEFDYAVIDGRQRMETIWEFIEGKFNLADDFDYQRDPELALSNLSYDDLANSHPKIRIRFDSFVLPIVAVETDDIDLIEDMFSRLNEAVPLNAAEKRNAIGGDLVAAIREIEKHRFFRDLVVFGNKRAQHREISARLLLIQHNLATADRIIDTKREYLDALAEDMKKGKSDIVNDLQRSVTTVLDTMARCFNERDPLLRSQGNMVIFFLLFRGALHNGEVDKISRKGLDDFRTKLDENRTLAATDFVKSDYRLLEYDRLSQQGTNDASNIRQRYEVLADFLGVTIHY